MPVPSMLSRSEVDYLYWLASTTYSGRGRIVDLGCFLGGSTMPLVRGLIASAAGAGAPNMLTYDSFVMDSDTSPRFPLGLGSGDSFRPVFETYLRDYLERITIREGWLPSEFTRETAARLYPEQEPIEILFIDIAKLWPVHDVVLRTFGPHLLPGAVVIQQDFKHHATYWLGLHMLQLRDCFEPQHNVMGGASVSFRCTRGIQTELQALLTRDDIPVCGTAQAWCDVDRYWAGFGRGQTSTRLVQRLAAATHLADVGRPDESLEFLHLFESEFRCAPMELSLLRYEYNAACRRIAETTGRAGISDRLSAFEALSKAEQQWRDLRRREAIDRCLAAGHEVIALYGAGRHTAELLAAGWPNGRLTVAAVLDDFSLAREVCGVPVVRSGRTAGAATAILVSSDTSEEELYRAATKGTGLPVLRIYSD
jgi:hypothetical protein